MLGGLGSVIWSLGFESGFELGESDGGLGEEGSGTVYLIAFK